MRWLVWRDIALAWRRRSDVLGTLCFFVMVTTLFPLALDPEPRLLRSIAPGIVWVAALLASMLSLNRLFADDYADGTLEQTLLIPQPLYLVVLGKVAAQWLVSAVPLIAIVPIVAVQFGLSLGATVALVASLALGTPTILLIGSIAAALTLGVRGGGTLTTVIVMPLAVPTVVFGAASVQDVFDRSGAGANFRLLGATFLLALVFAPWATSAALRISVE